MRDMMPGYAETKIDPRDAFDLAIAARRLSADETAPNYAGHYMYMGTRDDGKLLFKHRDTRQYLA